MDRLVLPTAVVDFQREEVRGPGGTRIDLRARSFAVLRCLADHAERLVTKDDLLAECWPGVTVTEDSLAQCVSEIRQALGAGARDVIRTVPRRGYVLMPPSSAPQLALPFTGSLSSAVAVLPFDEFADNAGSAWGGICSGADLRAGTRARTGSAGTPRQLWRRGKRHVAVGDREQSPHRLSAGRKHPAR
jgi:hypothetical protein